MKLLEDNLDESVFVINIETLNINMILRILYKTHSDDSHHLQDDKISKQNSLAQMEIKTKRLLTTTATFSNSQKIDMNIVIGLLQQAYPSPLYKHVGGTLYTHFNLCELSRAFKAWCTAPTSHSASILLTFMLATPPLTFMLISSHPWHFALWLHTQSTFLTFVTRTLPSPECLHAYFLTTRDMLSMFTAMKHISKVH